MITLFLICFVIVFFAYKSMVKPHKYPPAIATLGELAIAVGSDENVTGDTAVHPLIKSGDWQLHPNDKFYHLLRYLCPPWYPFIGSSGILHHMTKKYGSEWKASLELSKVYATNVLGLSTSSELLVVVSGEHNVRQVLNNTVFDARPNNFFAQLRCLGKINMGITFACGEIWKEHRQFFVKNLKRVSYGSNSMEREIQNELKTIINCFNNDGRPIKVNKLLGGSIMNVLWMFVAGERMKEDRLKHLQSLLRQTSNAFTLGGGLLNYIPWCRYIIPKISGFELITSLNEQISEVIEEAIVKHKNKEVEGTDFIYQFLEEVYAKRSSFTEEQLKIVCLDLLIAVSITSSSALGFALLKAINSQDIQEKMYTEIETVLGDKTPSWSDNEKLVYTSAFILEVHRYFSIAAMVGPRRAMKDIEIDGYLIPKDTTVLISLADIHHDPTLFKDPYEFIPERFIGENGRLKNSEHMYHFGGGRRRCPGESLARSFTFITLVGILQKYKVVSDGTPPTETPIIGMVASPTPYKAVFLPRK